ncbi:hexose-6-phosphate:phosphate antiporter [Endozoicomonas sp. Mp262]|uniref:hexose-6-phosphate:phosphate antiporter n=1 Tax=Endozoicomonas sp. Mp262 TaxID=2919499 RepID=UPI0021D8BA8E
MINILKQVRKPTLNLPVEERRKMWFKPFMQSYLVVFIGYMTMYFIRKNFNIAQNDMMTTYGLSMTQLGMIGLGFSITYGIGKTVVSYYADGKNTKQFLPFMLILSGIAMLGFSVSMGGSSASLFMMVAFYGLSGFFQSTGGPSSYSTITKWTPRTKRGTYLGLWNMSHNIGGAGAAGVALFGANYFFDGHVIGMFVVPSIIAIVVGFIGLRYGSDSPEAYGLGTAEELFGEEVSEEDSATEKQQMSKKDIFLKYVLKNKVIWLLCFANIFLYIVRIGIDQWSTVYAYQELGLPKDVAIQGFTMFEVGALVGTLMWGYLSDLANGRRALVACVSLILIIFTLGLYQHASSEYMYLASLFALGFLVFGPQLLIGVAAVGFVPKKAISVADGIKGTFAYLIGDSFAKLGLGMIADGTPVFGMTGWKGTFAALDTSAIVCVVLLAFVAIAEEKKIRSAKNRQAVVGDLQAA